jgi:hypothetical protein
VDVFETDLVHMGMLMRLIAMGMAVAVFHVIMGVLDVSVGMGLLAMGVLVDVRAVGHRVVAHRFLLNRTGSWVQIPEEDQSRSDRRSTIKHTHTLSTPNDICEAAKE